MADALSIAASITGLLATASKICSALSGFVSSAIDAPDAAGAVLTTVEEMRLALEMVNQVVETVSSLPSARKALLRLDHIAITFSNCILTLSELESLVCFRDGVMHRLRWAWGEKKVLRLLPRLESQKTSLSLMVTVLLCQSEFEALEGRERLNAAVDQILQRDEGFAARIQHFDGSPEIEEKLVVVGDHDTKKTETLTSYTTNKFPTEYVPTVFDNYAVTVMIGDDPYTLGLINTDGQEDYDRLRPLDYAKTDVFLVFARIGLPSTYDSVEIKWVPEIQQHCPGVPFIIVGIKCDVDEESPSMKRMNLHDLNGSEALGEAMARRLGAVNYMECDIVSQYRLKGVFDEVGFPTLGEEKIS
ncbi:cell division control protein 42 [Purpureocillium lilacinum]|uniref:Cell division control protein 42 n=1 Tax=Purpureocillium lilacinum TaxID=33203 RepID=A0A179G9A3_PURLI|nr:cell division control protein 42 [Purpureocillium lilacinum]OAQ74397.1 cell division control protein 42 [Purpureocillium lilacinum]